jgi:hypothetical protein
MRVLILTSCATATQTFAADEEHDLDEAVAHELVRAGLAQPVVLPFAPESANAADAGEVVAAEAQSASAADEPTSRRRGRPRRNA